MSWYDALAKPGWTPPPAVIRLMWTIPYPIILVSFGSVFLQAFRGKIGWRTAVPFAINLAANLLFMPVFVGLRSLPLASLDIAIVWVTIVWAAAAIWPRYRWVALAQAPYFAWVSVAMVLQLSITAMNWGR